MYTKRNFMFVVNMMLIIVIVFDSCSSIQAGLYLISIDDNNGETILTNEPNVKMYLENIGDSYENYVIKAFARTGVNYQIKRTKLLTHSYYVLICNDGEYRTLSFYGTKMDFYSEGAWALDADSDISSYRMYLKGDNKWDVEEIFTGETVDVRETVKNIIKKMNSAITYYFQDHITNRSNMDNCNTALYETIVLVGRNDS